MELNHCNLWNLIVAIYGIVLYNVAMEAENGEY